MEDALSIVMKRKEKRRKRNFSDLNRDSLKKMVLKWYLSLTELIILSRWPVSVAVTEKVKGFPCSYNPARRANPMAFVVQFFFVILIHFLILSEVNAFLWSSKHSGVGNQHNYFTGSWTRGPPSGLNGIVLWKPQPHHA